MAPAPPRRTQAERRAQTRLALLDAAVAVLVEEGYANLTTRRVAERAGVAQSTQMHHFPNREEFLVEALGHVAQRMSAGLVARIDRIDLEDPARRAILVEACRQAFCSPIARALTQLCAAAHTEPGLARALSGLEADVADIVMGESAGDPDLRALVDAALCVFGGMALMGPVIGEDGLRRRWEAVEPVLLQIGARAA